MHPLYFINVKNTLTDRCNHSDREQQCRGKRPLVVGSSALAHLFAVGSVVAKVKDVTSEGLQDRLEGVEGVALVAVLSVGTNYDK